MEATMSSHSIIHDFLSTPHDSSLPKEELALLLATKAKRYWPLEGIHSNAFRARFPDQKQLLKMARLASRRIIRQWHPWHMEITHSNYRLEKNINWFTPPNGDHEWIESLVRFHHMIDLAAAYKITGKQRFLDSFYEYMLSFNQARSKPGRHWKYKLNPAIRIINLIRAYSLLCKEEIPQADLHLAVHESLLTDISFLIPALPEVIGNGAFFVTTALLIAAEFLEEIYNVTSWKTKAQTRLLEILDSEIQADGIEVEQAPMYHGEVLLTLLDYAIALQANEQPICKAMQRSMKLLLNALVELSDPQGMIPPIGDSDRLAVAYLVNLYKVVMKKDALCRSPCSSEITLDHSHAGFRLHVFKDTGWAIMRWNWDEQESGYLLFDCSGKPAPGLDGHSHADDLQFLLHDSSGPIFTDPGRFTYCSEFKAYFPFTRKRIHAKGRFRHLYNYLFPRYMSLATRDWRDYFMSPLAHNTITPDDGMQQQAARHGQEGANVQLVDARTNGPLALLEGKLTKPHTDSSGNEEYHHQRILVGCYPDLWIVIDHIHSPRAHDWTASFHLGEKIRFSKIGDSVNLQTPQKSYRLHMLVPDNDDFTVAIEDDWVSPNYNEKHSSRTIRIRLPNRSEVMILNALCCRADDCKIEKIETVTGLGDDGTEKPLYSIEFRTPEYTNRLLINPGCQSVTLGNLRFDAYVVMESHDGHQRVALAFLRGNYLESGAINLESDSQGNAYYHV
jgi:hypothetical protein